MDTQTPPTAAPPGVDLVSRIRAFEEEYLKLLEKYHLTTTVKTVFPMYNPRMLPAEIKLALEVIEKHNPEYKLMYLDNP